MDDFDRNLGRAETQASETFSQRRTSYTSSSDSSTLSVDQTISRHPTHVERSHSARIQHVYTVGSHPDSRSLPSVRSQAILRTIGGGKPFPPDIPAEREAYVVDFEGPDDPMHPMNWKTSKKYASKPLAILQTTDAVPGLASLQSVPSLAYAQRLPPLSSHPQHQPLAATSGSLLKSALWPQPSTWWVTVSDLLFGPRCQNSVAANYLWL